MRYAAGAVLRLAVVLAVGWLAGKGFDWVTTRGDDSGGANIGAGLFAFAIGGLVILLWSFLDGRRHGWPALWTWGMMALLLALVAVVVIAILALLGPSITVWLSNAGEWLRQVTSG